MALADSLRLPATRPLLGVAKGPIIHWLPVWGGPCQHVRQSFLRHLHGRACQLDALWTCFAKQAAHLTSWEKQAAIAGDAGGWIAGGPVNQLGLAGGVGPRPLCAARQLVAQLKA